MDHIFERDTFEENWFSYPKLYSRVVDRVNSGAKIVEIGSWKGKSSAYMAVEIANSNKDIDFYCVDTWEGSVEHTEEQKGDNLYQKFLNNMRPVEKYYFPIKLNSIDASKKFKDNSLDFVFIDASHEYEDVKQDIIAWLPKVKEGGILAGHDYTDYYPAVIQAADEILGRENLISSESCFIFHKNILNNFPSINVISITESTQRRDNLLQQLKKYKLVNKTEFIIYERYKEEKHSLSGTLLNRLSPDGRGPLTSHLKTVKYWLENTNEDETFICEDDLSLETVKYWNFSWEDFRRNIPKNWGVVQFVWVREIPDLFAFGDQFRNRCWCDWSAAGYLIKRSYAEKLVEHYHKNDSFTLEYSGKDANLRNESFLIPTVETILFTDFDDQNNRVYSFPLFVEDIKNCNTTKPQEIGVSPHNIYSHEEIIKFWQTNPELDYIFKAYK